MATSGVMRMRGDDDSDTEYKPIYDDNEDLHQRTAQETKGWNLFRDIPVKKETGSTVSTEWVDNSIKVIKLLAYILVFAIVLGSAVIVKGTLLFITSQLKKERQINHCNKLLALDQQFVTVLPLEERVTWLWAVFIVFSVPKLGVFLRSIRICFFKSIKKPTKLQFFVAFVVDTLQTVALASLLLIILPELDVLKGAMLMNALCIVPAILNAFGRDNTDPNYYLKIAIDILAVSIQATAFVVWPLLNGNSALWCIPFACIFISLGWWENYVYNVDKHSSMLKVYLYKLRIDLKRTRYYTQSLLSIWKIIVFMICIIVYSVVNEDDPFSFFTSFNEAFNERTYKAYEVQAIIEDAYDGLIGYEISGSVFDLPVVWSSALWVALINVASAFFCYTAAKFACKILIQGFSFTFALTLVGPVAINILIVFCGIRNADPCAFHDTIPDYLFFNIPPVYFLRHFIRNDVAWIWLLWLLSQTWVTMHTWYARCERLAATEKLFNQPWYCGPLIDQSLLLNRSRDETEFNIEDLIERRESERTSISSEENINIRDSDKVPRIFICATMWHETKEEMLGFLKSIYRLDEDQSARRVAQKYLGVVDPDYYELEANIFLDDGFKSVSAHTEDSQVNSFVKCLIECIDEAASEVHLVNVRLRPPKKYPTPYGGRLEWTLPGKNKLICHMKDKTKVRHKKRWSQVMYMYYFLGHRLMDCPISVDRKEVIAENTFLLALDGDIDFKPAAVTLLIDLMKKNKKVGAACGRIHPVGSGFMSWYQSFEYAVGHWLQKATEHMIGCVLCSPGCFSLFRGKALMDDNVMRRYTLTSSEARHFVQYDQGEDRWLCTLLLQRGYRVEYSAASDAYTHCPEHFDEFYNQRRRWVPSTMANIMDLLADSKHTVSVNDSISTLYIIYQGILMAGSILGPGTIFLMMVGAMNAITGMSNMNALFFNLIPILAFLVICMTCESKVQLTVATIITCAYAMLMMMVIVGIAMQILEDGWLAPSSIFTIITFGIFIITALLHPQEMKCLLCIVIYYITIPSMYMLLIIYSLCNLNNISWGTREVPQQKSEKELEMQKKEVEAAKKKMDNTSLLKWFGKTEETSGTLECGVAGVFRCMCCTNPKDHKEDLHLLQIANTLDKIEKKIDTLGASEEVVETAPMNISRRRSSVAPLAPLQEYPESDASGDTPREERDDQVNPYWIEDPDLLKGEVDFLTTAEITFWKDMIDTYLEPILENKEEKDRVTRELKNLRDMMVFAFVMLNALFVLVIFLLQLNQDQIHLEWPLGQDITISYDDDSNTVVINMEYLLLEPIGILFLVVFGLVMLIQFGAMFLHRIVTLTHLLSTTQINWFFTKQPEELSEQAMLDKNAVQLAKELQKLNVDDLEQRGVDEENVTRRKTILNLERGRDAKQNNINLDDNFKRRLTILQDADVDTISRMPSLGGTANARRATLRAIMTRRDSVVAEKRRSQSQLQADTDLYDSPANSTARFGGPYPSSSYEPALDEDDEPVPTPPRSMPRRSTVVRFKDTYNTYK